MNTDAPGKFSCEIYLQAWGQGFREGAVMRHIGACGWCNTLVEGGADFETSIVDEADRQLKLRARRRFLRNLAAGVAGVGLTAFAWNRFQIPVDARPVAFGPVERRRQAIESELDALYMTNGAPSIENIFASGDEQDLEKVMDWVVARDHRQFFDRIISLVGDSRESVANSAVGVLYELPPGSLVPFYEHLKSAITTQHDPWRKEELELIAERVDRAK